MELHMNLIWLFPKRSRDSALGGQVRQDSSSVVVELSPFNDRQYNRDLAVLCERVNNASLHFPDGRRLLFTVKTVSRPILEVQKRPVA